MCSTVPAHCVHSHRVSDTPPDRDHDPARILSFCSVQPHAGDDTATQQNEQRRPQEFREQHLHHAKCWMHSLPRVKPETVRRDVARALLRVRRAPAGGSEGGHGRALCGGQSSIFRECANGESASREVSAIEIRDLTPCVVVPGLEIRDLTPSHGGLCSGITLGYRWSSADKCLYR
jgi:hypothetical protein